MSPYAKTPIWRGRLDKGGEHAHHPISGADLIKVVGGLIAADVTPRALCTLATMVAAASTLSSTTKQGTPINNITGDATNALAFQDQSRGL